MKCVLGGRADSSSSEAGHGRRSGVRLRDESVFACLWRISPQPSVDRLIVEVRIDPVAAAHGQIVGRLRLVVVQHDQFGAMVSQIVGAAAERRMAGWCRRSSRCSRICGRHRAGQAHQAGAVIVVIIIIVIITRHCSDVCDGHAVVIIVVVSDVVRRRVQVSQRLGTGRQHAGRHSVSRCGEFRVLVQHVVRCVNEAGWYKSLLAVAAHNPKPLGVLTIQH